MSVDLSTNRLVLDFSSASISIAVRREVELVSIRISEVVLFELPATTGLAVEVFVVEGLAVEGFVVEGLDEAREFVEMAELDVILSGVTMGADLD